MQDRPRSHSLIDVHFQHLRKSPWDLPTVKTLFRLSLQTLASGTRPTAPGLKKGDPPMLCIYADLVKDPSNINSWLALIRCANECAFPLHQEEATAVSQWATQIVQHMVESAK